MPYRYHPVIPAEYVSTSMPEGDRDYPCRLTRKFRAPVEDEPKNTHYSRQTMAYTTCTLIAAMSIFASGIPFLALGEEMAWWLWAIFPFSGSVFGLLVLIWRGGKDDKSRGQTQWKAVFGLVGGVGIPRFWFYVHPAIAGSDFMRDPIMLSAIGFLCFLIGSGMAAGVMKWWDKDAPEVGYQQARRFSKENLPPTETDKV
jgi:hypothetical protein